MEITINIPRNEYVQPTEIRQEVVQGICDAFLAQNAFSCFHPFSEGVYRPKTLNIRRHKGDKKFYGFASSEASDDELVRFNGEEMKAAFRALQNAGYFMYRIRKYDSWVGYIVYPKPEYNGVYHYAEKVTDFTDFID